MFVPWLDWWEIRCLASLGYVSFSSCRRLLGAHCFVWDRCLQVWTEPMLVQICQAQFMIHPALWMLTTPTVRFDRTTFIKDTTDHEVKQFCLHVVDYPASHTIFTDDSNPKTKLGFTSCIYYNHCSFRERCCNQPGQCYADYIARVGPPADWTLCCMRPRGWLP